MLPDGNELKTSGFADDTALYIRDSGSLAGVRVALDMYCRASAASVNHDKTVGVMLGGADPWVQQHMSIERWVGDSECERYLGAYFGDPDGVMERWKEAVSKMRSRAAKWSLRELSLYGRCLVHKASIASCLWFMCSVMDTPEYAQDEMRGLMDSMIWRGGSHLVGHSTCCMTQSLGGFKKMDTDLQLQARRASWGVRYLDPQCTGRWVSMVTEWLREGGMGADVWLRGKGGRVARQVDESNLPEFWKQCIRAFWGLRVRRLGGSDPHMHSVYTHAFHTVTIAGHCTVQYHNTQWVALRDFTVKLAYWCLARYKWPNIVPTGQVRWTERGVTAEWPVAWANIRSDTISNAQAERSYKLMHNVGPASNRLCGGRPCACHCGHTRVSMWHGVFECPHAMRAWSVVEVWWSELGGTSSVQCPVHKLTVTTGSRGEEVDAGVWRLLCACMLDSLWTRWTKWVHQGQDWTVMEVLTEWQNAVWQRVQMLWVRAVRLCADHDRHVDYVPGCIWSKTRVDHIQLFRDRWEGPLGKVVQGRWVPSQLIRYAVGTLV